LNTSGKNDVECMLSGISTIDNGEGRREAGVFNNCFLVLTIPSESPKNPLGDSVPKALRRWTEFVFAFMNCRCVG